MSRGSRCGVGRHAIGGDCDTEDEKYACYLKMPGEYVMFSGVLYPMKCPDKKDAKNNDFITLRSGKTYYK